MATVYEIKIKTVSPWINRSESEVKEIIENLLSVLESFENTEVEVQRI